MDDIHNIFRIFRRFVIRGTGTTVFTEKKVSEKARKLVILKGIVEASFLPLLIKVLGTVVTFALAITLARVLGLSEFGLYSLVVSSIMVISIPVQSGLQPLATRTTANAVLEETPADIKDFLSWSTKLILGYSLMAITIIAAVKAVFNSTKFVELLFLSAVLIFVWALILRNSAVLRGVHCFVKGTCPDVLLRPASQLVFISIGLFLIPLVALPSAKMALITLFLASLVALFASYRWMRLELKKVGVSGQGQGRNISNWYRPLFFLTVAGGGQVLFGHVDTLMLGMIGESAEVGAYRAAVQVSMLLIFLLTVMNQVLQPSLVKLHRAGDKHGMQELIAGSSSFIFLVTFFIAIFLLIFGKTVISLTFGADFAIASLALQILIVGQIFNVFFGSVGTILNMTGMEKEALISIAAAIVLNIVLDCILIPIFGIAGAAAASAISIFVWNSISRHYVALRLGIESSGVIYKLRNLF